jgi:alpha-beta hydrolase superfamily lysophospholipase
MATPAIVSPSPSALLGSSKAGQVEDVRIQTKDGLKLGAGFYGPRKAGSRAPAVLIAHAPGTDRTTVHKLSESLSKKGFAVLALDLRGHGASAADQSWEELDRGGRERMWTFTQRDLNAAASYLRGRREVHTTNLTVVGVGSGCALALAHAAQDENARAVILLDPTEDQLSFSLPDEIRRCGGLPTLVVSPRDGRARAKRLVDGLKTDGYPDIELSVLRTDQAEYLVDKKMTDKVTSYLRQTVVESKGR